MRVYLSKDVNEILIKYIKTYTENIAFVENNGTYPAINNHPDIAMCQLGNEIFLGDKNKIGYNYPDDIIYNGACTGSYFIHNLKYTDEDLLKKVNSIGLHPINVKQGYTKCSVVTLGKNAIITSDLGIAKACKHHMSVLTISPGHINLPGMTYGFIGGCSGVIGDTVIFNGNLQKHPDFKIIVEFINSKNMKVKWFTQYELTDIGSILVEQ